MTTTVTPNLGLTVPGVGTETFTNAAGEINGDLAIIDTMYGGANALSVAGGANVTVTGAQAQNLIQQFTGALTGNITVFLPASGAFYAIENATTGGFSLAVGCTGGSNTITVPQGLSIWVWTDGTTIRLSNPPGWTEISNTVVSGAASVAIALPAPFRRFRLTCQNVTASAAVQLVTQLSVDGGATFLNSSSYSQLGIIVTFGSSSPLVGFSSTTTFWPLSGALSAGGMDGTFEICPGSASGKATYRGSVVDFSGGFLQQITLSGVMTVSAPVNAMVILVPSGTFSGLLIVEGLP